ncbi:putative ripening-related protein 2 [Platanthera guangdongensis]|uniref:Ripening-related protein 2 n=1 Tax=Platanthera guangdongensis TaxID=2320717 RepID=A0ABR2MNF2_9ASPA
MTFNNFVKHRDDGGRSKCDGHYHSIEERVIALSTDWYNHKGRCMKNIRISANERSVLTKVVNECDLIMQ